MSQLTRSVIDLAPDVRNHLRKTTPNVNNIPKEPLLKKVESTPVDSEK